MTNFILGTYYKLTTKCLRQIQTTPLSRSHDYTNVEKKTVNISWGKLGFMKNIFKFNSDNMFKFISFQYVYYIVLDVKI